MRKVKRKKKKKIENVTYWYFWCIIKYDAYHYLPASVAAFPEGQAFLDELKKSGFTSFYLKKLSGGIASIYSAKKWFYYIPFIIFEIPWDYFVII